MMRTQTRWAARAAAVTLAFACACGRTPCEATRDMLQACGSPMAEQLDVQTCDRAYEACSSSEKAQIVEFNDCMAKEAGCSSDASAVCAPKLDGVSQGCLPRSGS